MMHLVAMFEVPLFKLDRSIKKESRACHLDASQTVELCVCLDWGRYLHRNGKIATARNYTARFDQRASCGKFI